MTISPLARIISIDSTVLSKKPYLNELLSPEVPAKPPPTVIPGNSITTGGSSPYGMVAATKLSIGTFGSTKATFASASTFSTLVNPDVSTSLSRWNLEGRVLFVEP